MVTLVVTNEPGVLRSAPSLIIIASIMKSRCSLTSDDLLKGCVLFHGIPRADTQRINPFIWEGADLPK